MSHDSSHEPTDNTNYEKRDVHVSALTGFFVFLMVFMLASILISIGFHKGYLYIQRTRKVEISPLANFQKTPPEPRLQVDPTADLDRFKAVEAEQLSSYGWVDAEKGVVRLPIERAKELALERGL